MKHNSFSALCTVLILSLHANYIIAQGMSVNTSGVPADGSAMLDVSSTTKGMLVPRMTAAQIATISSPATGLLAYQTDGAPGFYYYTGSAWQIISGSGNLWYTSGYSNIYTAGNTATGDASVAMGIGNVASGYISTAMGQGDTAGGALSTAMGQYTSASGNYATALGAGTVASGQVSTAMGYGDTAGGNYATAMGFTTSASNSYSTAMGINTLASGLASTAMGSGSVASGNYSSAMGYTSAATGIYAIATGDSTNASGNYATAMGGKTTASGYASTALGYTNSASGIYSTAMGDSTKASGNYATAMGAKTNASGYASTALGYTNTASGIYSTAIGDSTTASGAYSTAMGWQSVAGGSSGQGATAMGLRCTATGYASTAMGGITIASGRYSTAMGEASEALGINSTAMGYYTTAQGSASTTLGAYTYADGNYSTAMGVNVGTGGYDGSFIIGDDYSGDAAVNSATNQMMMRFANGYVLYTSDATTVGVQVGPGGNSWSTISDRRKKENFVAVNEEDLLKKIDDFTLTSWNYKGQDPKIFRHYGPMAQDFYAAFGKDSFGTIGNDTTINQADMEGVSFIAIQALEKRAKEQAERINKLEAENAMMRNQSEKYVDLSKRLEALEAALSGSDKVVLSK